MRYTVEISDTTGFYILEREDFDDMDSVIHYLNSVLPYIDYYEYSAIVDAIDTETGEIMSTDEYCWFVTNCGSGLVSNRTYEAH